MAKNIQELVNSYLNFYKDLYKGYLEELSENQMRVSLKLFIEAHAEYILEDQEFESQMDIDFWREEIETFKTGPNSKYHDFQRQEQKRRDLQQQVFDKVLEMIKIEEIKEKEETKHHKEIEKSRGR